MGDLSRFTDRILKFREERNWKQFHTTKDMMLSLMLEAAELAEHSQWKSEAEFQEDLSRARPEIGEELSDIFYWTLLIANDLGIDLGDAFEKKMLKNEGKYPANRAKGSNRKYDQL